MNLRLKAGKVSSTISHFQHMARLNETVTVKRILKSGVKFGVKSEFWVDALKIQQIGIMTYPALGGLIQNKESWHHDIIGNAKVLKIYLALKTVH